MQDCTANIMNALTEHYNRDIRNNFKNRICPYARIQNKLLKEYIEKCNKDLIYKKDIKFINAKIAFNGKYAYK